MALVFSDPGCSACAELEPKLEQLRAARGEVLGVTLITSGDERARELFEAFRIRRVPSATIVDAWGKIASPTVTGGVAIEQLLAVG